MHRLKPDTHGTRRLGRGAAAWALLVGVTLLLSVGGSPAAQAASGASRATAKHQQELRKARVRRALRRQVKRSPAKALRDPRFLRRAAYSDFALPVTFRLRPETQLGVTVLSNRRPLDSLAFPEPAQEQTLDLAGQFSAEITFGDSGFGIVGSMQARTGQSLSLASTSPLRLAEFGDCGLTPPDPLPHFLETPANSAISMSAGPLTWSLLNPFVGTAGGNLYVNLSLTSRVRRSSATCADPGDTADVTPPSTLSGAPVGYQPVRLDWDGKFRIAPAITADGAIRFGKIDADATVTPQNTTTGNLWACAPSSLLAGPTIPPVADNTCSEQGTPVAPALEPVSPAPFAAQFRFTRVAFDVLLGNVPAPPPALPVTPPTP